MSDSRKTAILKDTAIYATANYAAQGIGIFNSFLLRLFMGPAGMGVWSVLQVILSYCGYASLGTTRALARDYPLLRGQKKFDQADLVKDSTLVFAMAMSVIPAVLLLGYVGGKGGTLERSFCVGLVFLSVFLFVQRYYDFILTLLRSEKKFTVLSHQIVLNAAGGILVTLLLVRPWQIYGLYAGTAVLTTALVLLLGKLHPYAFKPHWDRGTIIKELRLGLPLVASAFLYTFLLGLDKLLLAKKLGFYDVGLYSIAMMVSNYILSLPMMFSNVLYPNLLELYGEKKEDPTQVVHYLRKPALILSVLVPFLCAMAFAVMPLLVELFLKKFTGGLPCMKVYLAGAFFLLLGQFSNNFLVTIDKYLRMIPVLIAAIAVNFLANQCFLSAGRGIEGVAWGTVLSFSVYGLASYFLALREVFDSSRAAKEMAGNLIIFGSFFAAVFIADRWITASSPVMTTLLKVFLFTLISSPYLLYMEKREHLFGSFAEILAAKFSSKKS